MVVIRPLKRKGTPKDSDKEVSEISGEEKRSEADQLILEPDGADSVAPTHSQSAPESTSEPTPANYRVAAATLTQVRGTTVVLWGIFGDQQPKRKWISRESNKAMSEPGEAKLLDAVAMRTLNLEFERRTTARDQNTVFKLRKNS